MTELVQLIYVSRPRELTVPVVTDILRSAWSHNARNSITGALICRQDVFMQLLEGPRTAVEETFARIEQDNRHTDVRFRYLTLIADRLFPAWAMRDAPASPWMWTPEEIADGAADRAAYEDFLNLYIRLAVELKAARRKLADLSYLNGQHAR